MFQMGTDLVSGGWDAITNIVGTIGKGASTLVSGFFPAPQREKVISETTMAAGGAGQTYRPTTPELQSVAETTNWAKAGWVGSPYQDQYAIPVKVKESRGLAESVGTRADPVTQGLDWALAATKKVGTLVDEISGIFSPREVITEKPRAGTPEGKNVQHLTEVVNRGADMMQQVAAWGSQLYSQVKGLFNLGYPQTGKQPGFAISHEIQPSPGLTWGAIAIVGIIVLLFILKKK